MIQNKMELTGESRGFVYVAYGATFLREAAASVQRVRQHHALPCSLITNGMPSKEISDAFTDVIVTEFRQGYDDKILMSLSPYKQTIFLDTDTTVLEPIAELFDLLERFDVAVQFTPGGHHYKLPGVPTCFYEPSAGILIWKKNDSMTAFFELWRDCYKAIETEQGAVGAWDQRSLRWALWRSGIKIGNIPAEYQMYAYKPEVCMGTIRMLHGRNISPAVRRFANQTDALRIYYPKVGIVPFHGDASLVQLCAFGFRFMLLIARQFVRRGLDRARIWPIPQKRRAD
jgi:hypothetical protein